MCAPRSPVAVVEGALRGGATAIQVRNKGDSANELARAVCDLLPLRDKWGALLIVNDRLDVALATGADGVHLGPLDLPVEAARASSPEGFVIGYSTDSPCEAARASREWGASYIGCGTVFATSTKGDVGGSIGPKGLREVATATRVPVVAVGGITAANVTSLGGTGAAGVAVVGALMTAKDPSTVATELRRPFG